MLYSTLLAATAAATLSSASPIVARAPTSFSVTGFGYGCSPGGCAYNFNVSLADGGAAAPAFSNIDCSGTGYDTPYKACDVISDTQTLGAWVNGTSQGNTLILKYEVVDGETTYDYYAQTPVESTSHCPTCPTTYEVPIVSTTAVA